MNRKPHSNDDEEKRAGIPVNIPPVRAFNVDEEVEDNENNDFIASNASMKRRKKPDVSKVGDAYSDSGIVGRQSSSKKKSVDSKEEGLNGKKHFFKSSKQSKKKVDETIDPGKVVPITTVVSSSVSNEVK